MSNNPPPPSLLQLPPITWPNQRLLDKEISVYAFVKESFWLINGKRAALSSNGLESEGRGEDFRAGLEDFGGERKPKACLFLATEFSLL